jgi:hypothetical protein
MKVPTRQRELLTIDIAVVALTALADATVGGAGWRCGGRERQPLSRPG